MREDEKSKGNLELKEWIQSALIAIILAFIIKMFLFDFVMVQGSSMFPTLEEGNRLIVNKIGYTIGEPDYGDIVILSYSDSVEYVKRVIGKAGDTIEIKDMVVYRNGEALSEDYINTQAYEDFAKVTVPDGTYFVMGDNRANSSDSRYPSLGFVKKDAIDGKVIFRIWPFTEVGTV
ncbi:signal peptidase I [Acetobacterium fimetarium]|uniref:Signal peptidase I n=1 Tax=Acetobacterium fimetarium TaxID=52691 RepID=A0ABR6WR71_9FIRM|nr:signal peptidase I [Acetobacterium fimetarium]MBC3803136.1 signal peptidase I [Acetobacterium fimetarium]